MYKLAVIGFGERINTIVTQLENTGKCVVAYVADPRFEEVKKEQEAKGRDISKIKFYATAEEMFENEKPDGVCIGTRCSLHAKYADMVIRKGYPLFLEKPVCTTREDLALLEKLLVDCPEECKRVTVSFPLRFTYHFLKAKELIAEGKIGEPAHVQGWCNVPYGVWYYHKWYRDDKETGGLFLQKATHDVDYITELIGRKPISVCAMTSKQVFKGDRPAGLLCRNCPEKDTCIDFSDNLGTDYRKNDGCCFAVDTGNEDSGSAVIMYDNGVHVSYSQNFISRRSAGKRGVRVVGRLGTVEFDWEENYIRYHDHYGERHDIPVTEKAGGHFGGDGMLIADYLLALEGKETSCKLCDGVRSAKLCLCLKESSLEKKFVEFR